MRAEKQLLLDEIKEKMLGSKALVWTRYQSLNPNVSDDFRGQLAKTGGSFFVVSKRLLIKAAKTEGITLRRETLEGHIGVVVANEDPISTMKALYDFSKKNAEIFEVLGGQFEGRPYTAEDVKAISQLPSQDEMRTVFLSQLEAPMAQTLSVMQALLTSIVYCLENKSQQGSE